MDVDVDVSGPFFSATGRTAPRELIDEVTWTVAGEAESTVSMLLDRSIRNPTPYYETQIIRERVAHDAIVHDRGIIYGPWLEGTGSRNETTRFKGYSSFRRATQQTEAKVPAIVEPIVDRWVRSMS